MLACSACEPSRGHHGAPARLGVGFRWLLASSWISNLGDGIALAAGPLLVASQTEDPFLVALAALLQWLPQLLFGLYAGALSDRLDRRLIVVTVDVLRAVVLVAIATSIVTGTVSIAVILVALFLLGTAEVFADNSSQTLLPMLVRRQDLALANSRIQAGLITVNQMAGPPVGAALFAAGMASRSGRPGPCSCSTPSNGSGWERSALACSRPSRRWAACWARWRTGGSPAA